MTVWLRTVLAIFAVYRLASLVSQEEGPYFGGWPDERQTGLFEGMRLHFGVYDYGPDGKPLTNGARGLACPLCTGVYWSALVTAALLRPTRLGDALLCWLGVSGAQSFLEKWTSDR